MVKQKNKKFPDKILLGVIIILILWGLFTTGAVSFNLSMQRFNTPWKYFNHQLLMFLIGAVLAVWLFKTKLEKIQKYSPLFFLINFILIFMVFLPQIGITTKGAARWLDFRAFSLQPSEFLKLSLILYLASWISIRHQRKKTHNRKLNQLLAPFLIILGALALGLYSQKDITTLAIVFTTALAIYFFSPSPLWHTVVVVAIFSVAFSLFITTEPYRRERITTFLKPSADVQNQGYQVKQAAVAIGSGKLFGIDDGLGLGMSRQKLGFLPESQTDSIFAIIGEESGFLGALALLTLFSAFFVRGLQIALRYKNDFHGFVAFGIVFWITLQALFNIAGNIGVLPLGGIPLPFFSYGGSHLIAELMACGILLNISRHS